MKEIAKHFLIFMALCLIPDISLSNPSQDLDSLLEFQIVEAKKYKGEQLYIINMAYKNEKARQLLDSLVKTDHQLFNFYGDKFINMQCDRISFKPTTYLFEDNMGGILPYYKFIVSFKMNNSCEKTYLSIDVNGKTYQISVSEKRK